MFQTPDAPATNETRFMLLRIPAAPGFSSAVVGALAELTKELNWQKVGGLKPYEAASIYARMVQDMKYWTPLEIGDFVDSIVTKDPAYFLLCDGSTYQAADWPELFALLPGGWKTATDFTLPDMAGVCRVGVGTLVTTDFNFLEAGGEMTHTLTVDEMPTHTHGEGIAVPSIINGGLEAPASAATASTGTTGPAGSGQPHNIMSPYLPVKVYIVGKLP